MGIGDALRSDPRAFVFGEDVGGKYGNAFLLLRPLLAEFGDRILNSPLAEGAVLGVCVGAALAGQCPIGEMQFNDFVATGFNQLVNNAAKIRYRWGGSVPMVVDQMTPLAASVPYNVAADGPFTISMSSMSSGLSALSSEKRVSVPDVMLSAAKRTPST